MEDNLEEPSFTVTLTPADMFLLYKILLRQKYNIGQEVILKSRKKTFSFKR